MQQLEGVEDHRESKIQLQCYLERVDEVRQEETRGQEQDLEARGCLNFVFLDYFTKWARYSIEAALRECNILDRMGAASNPEARRLAHQHDRVELFVPLVEYGPLDGDGLRELINPLGLLQVGNLISEVLWITALEVHVVALHAIVAVNRVGAEDAEKAHLHEAVLELCTLVLIVALLVVELRRETLEVVIRRFRYIATETNIAHAREAHHRVVVRIDTRLVVLDAELANAHGADGPVRMVPEPGCSRSRVIVGAILCIIRLLNSSRFCFHLIYISCRS